MEKFASFTSSAVPLPMEHVDTDQIIPARFLKMVTRTGFGDNLFYDWRYDRNGNVHENFVLNNHQYQGSILVAGRNFGCGSSREHAAWALVQYGFRVIVSSEFADIFKNNALNNGLLPITVSTGFLDLMFKSIENDATCAFEVDLPRQVFGTADGTLQTRFDVDPFKKKCLVQGMDELDYLISLQEEITQFEQRQEIY